MSDEEKPTVEFRGLLPPELQVGDYANFLSVSHTPHEFTLDFGVIQPHADPESQPNRQIRNVDIIARIKVPPSVIFHVARAIADNVDRYERRFGSITHRPEIIPPEFGEGDEPQEGEQQG